VVVRKLKLGSEKKWKELCKSGKRQLNIPSNPHQAYRDDGWISMPDWLDYPYAYPHAPAEVLPFAAARAIVRKLKLKSKKAWEAWRKSGKRPSNIPSNPLKVYRGASGWKSMPDWLGYEGRAGNSRRVLAKDMLPFAAARVVVWKVKLNSPKEWKAWSKSGQRPSNIPGCPDLAYRDDGWISWPDWLGYEARTAGGSGSESEMSESESGSGSVS
jgi:hypothetical protein